MSQELLNEYQRLKKMGAAAFTPPEMFPRQVRVEFSDAHAAVLSVCKGRMEFSEGVTTSGLKKSMQAALSLVKDNNLLRGNPSVLAFYLSSSSDFDHRPLTSLTTIDESARTGAVIDDRVVLAPREIGVPMENYLYHAMEPNSDGKVGFHGISIGAAEDFEAALPASIRFARYSGWFGAAQFILDNYPPEGLPPVQDEGMLCILRESDGVVLAFKRGVMVGGRKVSRSEFLSPSHVDNLLALFDMHDQPVFQLCDLAQSSPDPVPSVRAIFEQITNNTPGLRGRIVAVDAAAIIEDDPVLSTFTTLATLPVSLLAKLPLDKEAK